MKTSTLTTSLRRTARRASSGPRRVSREVSIILFLCCCALLWTVSPAAASSSSTPTPTALPHPLQSQSTLQQQQRYITTMPLLLRGGASRQSGLFAKRPAPTVPKQPQQQQSIFGGKSTANDKEDAAAATKELLDAFLTRDSRNSFIARVYAILSIQLLVTAGSVILFGLQPQLSVWMRQPGLPSAVPALSLLLSTVCWFSLSLSVKARRTSMKWNMLALFTLGEAVSVGFLSSFYKFRSVVTALMATATAATGVSLYTANQRNAKYDLSQWGAGLSSCGLIFVVYGLIQLLQMTGVLPADFLPYNDAAYGLLGAVLFSFYLAYHTKLIVAGKHSKYQMNEQDYVFGAMTLYNDIINLFIYMLRLIGEDRER